NSVSASDSGTGDLYRAAPIVCYRYTPNRESIAHMNRIFWVTSLVAALFAVSEAGAQTCNTPFTAEAAGTNSTATGVFGLVFDDTQAGGTLTGFIYTITFGGLTPT